MNGGSVLEYRLDPEFKRFAGAVVRGQADGVNGALKVNIKLDDKLVWSESLTDAQPRGFDIETGKARKVRLEVGLVATAMQGDNIRLLRPRYQRDSSTQVRVNPTYKLTNQHENAPIHTAGQMMHSKSRHFLRIGNNAGHRRKA